MHLSLYKIILNCFFVNFNFKSIFGFRVGFVNLKKKELEILFYSTIHCLIINIHAIYECNILKKEQKFRLFHSIFQFILKIFILKKVFNMSKKIKT